jgi:hypothetical protein
LFGTILVAVAINHVTHLGQKLTGQTEHELTALRQPAVAGG